MKKNQITQEEKDIRILIGYKNANSIEVTEKEKQTALKYMTEQTMHSLFKKYVTRTGCINLNKLAAPRKVVLNKPLS